MCRKLHGLIMVYGKLWDSTHHCQFQKDVFKECHMNVMQRLWMKFICISGKNPSILKFIRSSAALDFEKIRQINSRYWYIIHPFSLCRTFWQIFMIIVFFLDIIESAFFMTWRRDLCFAYSTDVIKGFCLVNVLVNFWTGYVDEHRAEIVLHQGKIIRNYFKGRFVFDLIAALPWPSLFSHNIISEAALRKNELLNIISFAAVFSIVNGIRFFEFSRKIMNYFDLTLRSYRIYRLVIGSLQLFHWLTCLQCNNLMESFGNTETALVNVRAETNLSDEEAYWSCLFRVTSLMTRISYGLSFTDYVSDIVIDLTCLIGGYVFFFFLLDAFLLLDKSRTSSETRYELQLELINEYMRQNQLPKLLQDKFRYFYEYRFQKMFLQESIILSTLSPRLRQEITLHTCRHLVQESVLFRNVPRSVMWHIIKCLKYDIFLPNEVLIKAGNYGDCMYFLTSGTVMVVTRTGKEVAHLKDGSFFGEMAMILENDKRITSVLAIEFCEVYRLDRVDFKRVIRPHEELYQEIQRTALDKMLQVMRFDDSFQTMSRNM